MIEQMGEQTGRIASVPVVHELTAAVPSHYQVNRLIANIKGKGKRQISSKIDYASSCGTLALKLNRSFEAVRGQNSAYSFDLMFELFA
jgi:hypothetical protein